jgi:hypothetical protein
VYCGQCTFSLLGCCERCTHSNFELDGQTFTAINGGALFKFTEAVSFVIRCDSQEEVDDYWAKLSAGGSIVAMSDNGKWLWPLTTFQRDNTAGNVAGSKTNLAFRGRSCRLACRI